MIEELIASTISFVMVIASLLTLLTLILGGIRWMTSGGDVSKLNEARNSITQAVIGLIILVAGYFIFLLSANLLGFEIDPRDEINIDPLVATIITLASLIIPLIIWLSFFLGGAKRQEEKQSKIVRREYEKLLNEVEAGVEETLHEDLTK